MANRAIFDLDGVRVSEPGWDVLTASRKHLLFHSKDRSYNVVAKGIINSYPTWQTWSSYAEYCDVLHGYTFVSLPSAMFMFDHGYWYASTPYWSVDPEDYRNEHLCEFNRLMAFRPGDTQATPGLHIGLQAFSAQIMSDRIRFFRSSICVTAGEYHPFGDLPSLPAIKYALIETGL